MDYKKHGLVLDLWASTKSSMAYQSPKPLNWEPAETFLAVAVPYFADKEKALLQLLDISNHVLAPLSDPLEVDFGTHRWLRGKREEAYSDWLAWALEQISDSTTILAIFEIQHSAANAGPTRITREYALKEGHGGCSGRVDILVECNQQPILLLEIKLGSADKADTEKHQGYGRSVNERVKKVILAADGQEKEYHGFELQRWSDVCIRLRRIVSGSKTLSIVTRTMLLGFVGAVEQNILGYPGNIRQYVLRNKTFPTAMLRHIDKATRKGPQDEFSRR